MLNSDMPAALVASSLDRLVKAHTPQNRHARRTSQATCRGFDSWASAVVEAGLRPGPNGREEGVKELKLKKLAPNKVEDGFVPDVHLHIWNWATTTSSSSSKNTNT